VQNLPKREMEDWLNGWMQFNENSEPPRMYHLWCAISVIGSALQRKCKLNWGTLTFYPNMYIVLVGPSGKCRKGTAMGPALSILEELNVNLAAESITREALIRELKNANYSDPDPSMQTLGAQHSSLTIFAPELTVFLGYHNHQLLSDLTDWYDCRNKWTYRTKNMGTDKIVGVYVNLIGATTPDLIRTTMPLDAIGGGLTSRMIFVYENKKYKTEPCPFLSNEDLLLRKKLFSDLEQIAQLRGEFTVTENFLARWIEWYTAQESNPPFDDSMFAGYIERRPNHVMKLSMIVNASRTNEMKITRGDLDRAIKILTDTEINMPATFAGVGKYEHADVLARVMEEIGLAGEITLEHLQAKFARDASSFVLDQIIQTLDAMGFVDQVNVGNDLILRYNPRCEAEEEE
jgi:hypothetical protein